MDFLPLLGESLKGDAIVEILELFDMSVVYDFDRLREGTPDRYWSESRTHGFQFGFEDDQRLALIFLYVSPREGFTPIDVAMLDVPAHATLADARMAMERAGILDRQGEAWVRSREGDRRIHYEYRDGALSMITLSLVHD